MKLVHIADMRESPIYAHPVMDAGYHDQWARSLLAGAPMTDGQPYFRAPLYPYWLAALYKVSGGNHTLPRIAQAILGIASLFLLHAIGRRLFGATTAILAVVLGVLYPLLTYFEGELLITSVAFFLNVLLLWALLRAERAQGAPPWILAGLVLGAAAIARPNVLLFSPLIVLWIALERRSVRAAIMPGILVALASLLVILPVTIRNARVGGEAVFISWQGGINFYLGNHVGADGWSATAPGIRKDWWGGYEDTQMIPQREARRRMTYGEISDYWFARGLAFLRDNPAEGAALLAKKTYLVFSAQELSNNLILSFSGRYSRVFRSLPVTYGMLIPLALFGFWCARRNRTARLLSFHFAAYAFTLILFFVCSRFRIPLLPAVLLFAGEGLRVLAGRVRERKAGALVSVAWIAALFAAVNIDFGVVGPLNLAYGLEGEGLSLLQQERYEEAADRFRAAIAEDPNSRNAHHDLGIALRSLGRGEEAAAAFEKSITLDRTNAEAYNNLALTLSSLGRNEEALRVYEQGIAVDSRHPGLRVNRAQLLQNEGRLEDAVTDYRAFIASGVTDGRVHTNLGLALAGLERHDEAERELRLGRGLAPDVPNTTHALARFLLDRGRRDEAAPLIAEGGKRWPGDPRWEVLRSEAESGYVPADDM
ncbi:MAG: tetratricopeptide repeat protein [Gemmatimonadetes bacterium]|nr:tetratricopeptide repeat protein [Gemmatimonadota bacterium]